MQHFLNSLFVLLVEPSRSQRHIVIQQFEDLGIAQYETAETGQEALIKIDTEQPDLVISSMFLEDMTGKDLVLEMRNNPVTVDMPFMLISTETSFSNINPIKQAGASAVLPKPFNASDLKRAIMMIMDWENPDPIDTHIVQNKHLLLVDDSVTARHMIRRTLEKLGIDSIDEAENGRLAIPMIQSTHYDMVLTDFNMPEMNGHDLLLFIRLKSNQRQVPVLMITTEGDERKLSAVEHDGVSAIMDKPFDARSVRQLLESVF